MSSSSDEDELDDGQYEMSSESKKFGLMSKHRDKVGAILTSAKNGKLNRLRTQLEEQSAKHASQRRSLKATIAHVTTEKEEAERLRDALAASMAQDRKLNVGKR